MKNILILIPVSFICAAFIYVNNSSKSTISYQKRQDVLAYKARYAFGCSPNLASIDFNDEANLIPLLDGWGKYRMSVTVSNDSANIYFQQGINMYYGFHIIEAMASFQKATKFDENFAMGYWGKALAYGPNINDDVYNVAPEAIASIQKAKSLSINCTPVEKSLINAMLLRYSSDTTLARKDLDQGYADAMKKVSADFPNNADAATLYADALMVQHPWDLYDRFYDPKPWTPSIVAVLEKLIKQFPENPGAGHYYIHAIEGSKHPEKGLEVADRLGALMPGLSHLVHMPSHIYIRSGHYNKGVEVNAAAVKDYDKYLSKYPPTVNNSALYLVHNLHMAAACANMDGQYTKALKLSFDTQKSFDSSWLDLGDYLGMFSQYVFMTPYFTLIRFGQFDAVLNAPAIPDSRVYANAIWHFARGIAYARKHQLEEANMEWQKMQLYQLNPQMQLGSTSRNAGKVSLKIASKILQGVIAEEKNQLPLSVALLKEAVYMEDGMIYNEPKDWLLPARHYLAHVLLKGKQYTEAEKIYKEDLLVNPNNVWSIIDLEKSLLKQSKSKEAKAVQQQLKKAMARADMKISSSVF